MTLANERFVNVKTNRALDLREALTMLGGQRIHALAGIGHPQRFFSHLTSLGMQLDTSQALADHHNFRKSDFQGINADIILMTEKDAVKCGGIADERMWFMRVDACLPNEFTDFVLQKLSSRKA